MTKLRQSLLSLLISLFVFLNIERLDVKQGNDINILTFVYFLAIGAVIVTIMIPRISRMRVSLTILVWILIYILLRLLVFDDPPFYGGIHTYLTITEMTSLAVLVLLAHNVGRCLIEFSDSARLISLMNGKERLQTLAEEQETVASEMNRSRHYGHPLGVLVAHLDEDNLRFHIPRLIQEVQSEFARRYANIRLGRLIRNEMRRMDVVMEDPQQNRIVVLSPEVSNENMEILLRRLQIEVANKLGVTAHFGIATYPDSALTFEDLLQKAEEQIQGQIPSTSEDSFIRWASID
jgi:GGDEF domain-containing protein